MKLTDIELTAAQASAFVDWLERRVREEQRRQEKEREAEALDELHGRWYEKLVSLAQQTARLNGPIEGLKAEYAATATWEAFVAGEGWFSSFDVDEYFEATAEYQETWEIAYTEEVRKLHPADRPWLNER